ncbi:MAG: single-stranded DNA-binding protein [Flavobacteriales bacterium]|jgi:single-strand DNA-binding protein
MNNLRNRVQLIGRLGKDPEVVRFEEGKVKASFPLATNEVFRNPDGERTERTQWHDIVAWSGLAEIVAEHLHKGEECVVEGRLSYRTFEDASGHTRYVTEVVMQELVMLERRVSAPAGD